MQSLLSKYIDFDPDEHDSTKDAEVLARDEDRNILSDYHHTWEGSSDHSTNCSLIVQTLAQIPDGTENADAVVTWTTGYANQHDV